MRLVSHFRVTAVALGCGLLLIGGHNLDAEVLKEARVSQVIKDVQLLRGQGAPKPATISDQVRQGTAVRTGTDSRAELTFTDLTIARLGANTIFSFDEGTRTVDLASGAILLRVPKDSGGAKIKTAAVTAAITGTTVLVEYHKDSYAKYITIEGLMRVYLAGKLGESILLGPGEMIIIKPNAISLPEKVNVDLDRLIHTSLFFTQMGPIGSETLMAKAQLEQLRLKSEGTLIDTNLVIFGRGTLVTLVDPTSLDVIDRKTSATPTPSPEPTPRSTPTPPPTPTPTPVPTPTPTPRPTPVPTPTPTPVPTPTPTPTPVPTPTPTPTPVPTPTPTPTPVPTPSKFGTPAVITSFIPYPIDNGTVIQTDPAIARAGVTDFGKIYRDDTQDGPFSAYAFTATSAFDTASGFDNQFVGTTTGNTPMAVFKFANLTLSGNPIISTANGGVGNLGLISVVGITSTPAGDTTFTFSGLRTVLLAAQNGSITLSGISFQNINTLIMYARGSGSMISLGAPVFGVVQLRLFAEGDIQVNAPESVGTFRAIAGNDFLGGSGPISAQTVFISTQRDINFSSQQFAVGSATGNTLFLGAARNLNIDITGDQSVFTNAASVNANGGTINIAGTIAAGTTNPITLDLGTGVDNFNAGAGGLQAPTVTFKHAPFDPANPNRTLNIRSAGDIRVNSISDANVVQAAGLINAANFIGGNTISAGQSITTGSDLVASTSITAGTTINAGGLLFSPLVTAGGNITAAGVEVLTINAPNGILTAGSQGIFPYLPAGPGAQHQFTINSLISPNGINFTGNAYTSNGSPAPQPGGKLNINATTLAFDKAGIAFANFNGSDVTSTVTQAGSGGIFTTTTTGNTTVNAPITATTGIVPNATTFSGAGGTVSLGSTAGSITVNSLVQVSSNDLPDPFNTPTPAPPYRQSASGGNITLHSDLTTGTGITVGQSGQLVSLLNRNAPGPGGSILLSTKGANITVAGQIQADRGTVTISQMDPPGQVPILSIDNAAITSEILDVSSAGNLNIGAAGPVFLDAVTITLRALNDINVKIAGNSSDASAQNSSGDVTFSAGGNLNFTDSLSLYRENVAPTATVNITLTAGLDLSVAGGLSAITSANDLQGGGNILVSAGANVSATGAIQAVARNGTGILGSGANVTLRNGTANPNSDLTTGYFALQVSNFTGTISNGANVTLTASRDVSTVFTPDPSPGMFVFNAAGGTITNGGNISFTNGRDVRAATSLDFDIDNGTGSTISTGGNILVSTGGSFFAAGLNVRIDNTQGGKVGNGGNIDFTVAGSLNSSQDANFLFLNSGVGQIGGTVSTPNHIKISAGDMSVSNDLLAYIDNSNGSIGPGGNDGTLTLNVASKLSVGGRMAVLGATTVNGTVSAGTLASTNVNAMSGGIAAGSGGITRFAIFGESLINIMHTLSAATVTSQGGIDFSGTSSFAPAGSGPFDGGQLTINAFSLSFGATGDIQGAITFDGGAANGPGPGASGGIFNVNTTGAISVNSNISASTGLQDPATAPSGNGGTVDLRTTQGTVTVSSPITVSSADPVSSQTFPLPPRRRSNSGGKINLQSGRSGSSVIGINISPPTVAINVTNTSSLLALLDNAATGPGGKITILATGTNSSINVGGPAASAGQGPTIAADRGTVDIRHTGDGGAIGLSNANIRADIVKVAALGANGVLTISGGTITADTILKLYAVGSNGAINFVANATLSGASAKTIAANTVNVSNNVIVTIGGGNPVDVYTNVPNYSSFSGGNGSTSGQFVLQGSSSPGAVTHAPSSTPPPLDIPPGP